MCDTDLIYELAELNQLNKVHPSAIIYKNVKIGTGNTIGPYTVIGSPGEIRGVKEFKGIVEIGNDNVISEHVTIQRPAVEGQKTVIGNGNLIMAHAHIGHDAKIGNNTEICSGVIIGGYAEVGDEAKVKLGVTVRNRKKIGKKALVGLGSAVVKDVSDGAVVYGNPAKEHEKK